MTESIFKSEAGSGESSATSGETTPSTEPKKDPESTPVSDLTTMQAEINLIKEQLQNKDSVIGRQGQELGELRQLRDFVKPYQKDLENIVSQKQGNQELAPLIADIKATLGEDVGDKLLRYIEKVAETKVQTKVAPYTRTLGNTTMTWAEEMFLMKHPEFNDPEILAEVKNVQKEAEEAERTGNINWDIENLYNVAAFRKRDRFIEKAVKNREEEAKRKKETVGAVSQAGGQTATPETSVATEADAITKSMLEAGRGGQIPT